MAGGRLPALVDAIRKHPIRWSIGALAAWTCLALLIDEAGRRVPALQHVLEGGQVTELLGGVFGLPLTGIAVVIALEQVEYVRRAPQRSRQRTRARTLLRVLRESLILFYLAPDPAAQRAERRRDLDGGDRPLTRTDARLTSEASDALDAVTSSVALLSSDSNPLNPFTNAVEQLRRSIAQKNPSRRPSHVGFTMSAERTEVVHAIEVVDAALGGTVTGAPASEWSAELPTSRLLELDIVLQSIPPIVNDMAEIDALDEIRGSLLAWSTTFNERRATERRQALRADLERLREHVLAPGAGTVAPVDLLQHRLEWREYATELTYARLLLERLAQYCDDVDRSPSSP